MDSTEQQQKPASRAWSNVKSVASTLLFVWLFTHHIAQATVVPTESMSPTILVGDHFFLDKVAFPANYPGVLQKFLPTRTIQRGEIVAFWSPEDRGLRLVKRVIAGYFGWSNEMQRLVLENEIEAYNLPQGVIINLYREIAADPPIVRYESVI